MACTVRAATPASIAAASDEVTVLASGTAVRLRLLGRGERDLVDVDGHRHVALVAEVEGECAGIARFVAVPISRAWPRSQCP
jgi:hypothetical protein